MVTAVETELERELSAIIIGSDPPFRRLRTGEALVSQGDPGDELQDRADQQACGEADHEHDQYRLGERREVAAEAAGRREADVIEKNPVRWPVGSRRHPSGATDRRLASESNTCVWVRTSGLKHPETAVTARPPHSAIVPVRVAASAASSRPVSVRDAWT